MNNLITVIFGLLLMCFGCANDRHADAYISEVTDYNNGMHVKKQVSEYYFDVQFLPEKYRNVLNARTSTDAQHEVSNTNDPLQYYKLTVGLNDPLVDFIDYGVFDLSEKQKKLYYYAYHFQEHIRLQTASETFPCVMLHFERQMDLRPSRTFLLAFPEAKDPDEQVKLIIDSPWISTLAVKIKISKVING